MPVTPIIQNATPGITGLSILITELERYLPVFMLVMARCFGLTMQAPFFSTKIVPATVRAPLVIALSMMYVIVFNPQLPNLPESPVMFTILMVKEVIIGALFGFCASIVVFAIQAAGEIADVQMGLSMVMLFNPATKSQSSAMGRLYYQIMIYLFLMVDAHLFLLLAFFNSFDAIPLGTFAFHNTIILGEFFDIVGKIFYVAVQIALPILVVLFIVDFSLGITNRVSPQINVLELNFAMKPTTGFIIILVILSTVTSVMIEYSEVAVQDAKRIVRSVQKAAIVEKRQEDEKLKKAGLRVQEKK